MNVLIGCHWNDETNPSCIVVEGGGSFVSVTLVTGLTMFFNETEYIDELVEILGEAKRGLVEAQAQPRKEESAS